MFADRGEHHRDLVATEPGREVLDAQPGLDPLRDAHQQRVPGGVPELVVDLLEPVEVEEQQGHRVVLALRGHQPVGEPVQEQGPAGQARQRVVERLVHVREGLRVGERQAHVLRERQQDLPVDLGVPRPG